VKRAFVVVNPAAGGGRTRRTWPRLREVLGSLDVELHAVETTGVGAGTELARHAVLDGWPLVVAVGGDGTVNEVVNGVMDGSGVARAAIGVIPTGRGRDVCRNLGVPRDPHAAARRAFTGRETTVDAGAVELPDGRRRYFVNAAGVGFDAAIAASARTGRAPGTLGYLLAVLRSLGRYEPYPVSVAVDGEPSPPGRVAAVVVANGAYYGGGMRIAPFADPTDGRLDVVILCELGRLALLRWLPTVYTGGHLRSSRVSVRSGRLIALGSTGGLPAHVDGEPLPEAPVRVSIHPRGLRILR
jgi:YegS/Rv2252/BmrU family lipid kinase